MAVNNMELGWLDINQAEQDKVKELLNLLQEKGTLDELGIGTIRDAFSNLLFPGITTIQTRAKYLVVLLYLFQEAVKEAKKDARCKKTLTPHSINQFLCEEQDSLVDIFVENFPEERGVIGRRTRNVVQKPSFIYWGALRTFCMVPKDLTFAQLCSQICYNATQEEQKRNDPVEDKGADDFYRDADDAASDGSVLFSPPSWKHEDWRDELSMDLTKEEAEFIYTKIITSPYSKNSALAQLLKYYTKNKLSCDFNNFEYIPVNALDSNMKHVYELALKFRDFIFGAHVVYNYLLTDRTDEFLKEEYEEWKKQDFSSVPLEEIFEKSQASLQQRNFLKELRRHAQNKNWEQFESCVQKRESSLKGARKKIGSPEYGKPIYENRDQIWQLHLDFRAYRAGEIIRDILNGFINK